MFWDFISLRPETSHQVSFLFSDRGIPDGYRHMNGYGSHTFKLVNKEGQPVYCKFHYKVCYSAYVYTNVYCEVVYWVLTVCCALYLLLADFDLLNLSIE